MRREWEPEELIACWTLVDEDCFQETLRRAVQRDRALFGSAQATRERYQRRYVPGQRRYLATVQPQRIAEVVTDNHDPATPKLISSRLDQPAGP